MLFRLLPYHGRLAFRSLRRDPGLSATIVIVMAVVSGIFCTSFIHYLRFYGPRPALPASLHHVEVGRRSGTLQRAFAGTTAEPNVVASRIRISYPSYRILAASHIPTRETASFRARILVRRTHEGGALAMPLPHNARFVNADFFSLFNVALRFGAPWTNAEEAHGDAVVVLSKPLNDDLFAGGDSVGQTVLVNERPFRIIGVCADHQPFVPEWDQTVAGGPQDLLYLPFPEHRRLSARPEMPVHVTPIGPTYADLLASDEVFLTYWLELPTPGHRDAYARYLAARLGGTATPYTLRDLAAVRAALPFPRTAVSFFVLLTFIVVLGGGLIMARLLLAKGLARREELGIFRALGAPRRSLFARQLLEAAMLAGAGGLLSFVIAAPSAWFYNRAVADTDIPLAVSGLAFSVTFAVTLGVGLLFAVYPAWRAANLPPTVTAGDVR